MIKVNCCCCFFYLGRNEFQLLSVSPDHKSEIHSLLEVCHRIKLDVNVSIVLEQRIDSGIVFHIAGPE